MGLTPPQLDRAAGTLVGLAAGDALGAGYEFDVAPTDPQMVGGGLGPWQPGEWTDDTQQAPCIAQVAATGQLDVHAVARGFLDWYHHGATDVGVQTRAVLRKAKSADDLTRLAAEHFAANPKGAAGNGSLMRTGPVALAYLGDDDAIVKAAGAISLLTHGDPLAAEACVLWCIAIDRAIREARLGGIYDGLDLLAAAGRDFWAGKLKEAESEPMRSFTPNGFVVTALQAAYAAVVQTPIPEDQPCRHLGEALRNAVRIGNDTDTIAAIAGALLGARWGATAVPMAWKEMLHGWPGYQTTDLVRLAVLGANRGLSDEAGWPSAESLADYYAVNWPCTPIAVPLPEDPGVIIGNVAGLKTLDPMTDVVVSLCRMGRDDVPEGTEHHEVFVIDAHNPEVNPNLDFVMDDVAESISRWRDAGRTVFLHCVRAESRTPAFAAAYLAKRFGIGGRRALQRVRKVLPDAMPKEAMSSALER